MLVLITKQELMPSYGVQSRHEMNCVYYRQPCVATQPIMFYLCLFYLFFIFFIQLSFSKTTGPILTKFPGIVYSGVVWIIR